MFPDQLVIDVIADLLDVDAAGLTAGTALEEVAGWDSVNALRTLVYLERSVGQPLDYERFTQAATVGDLAAVVASAAGVATATGAAAATGAASAPGVASAAGREESVR